MNRRELTQQLLNASGDLIAHSFVTFKDIYERLINLSPESKALIYHRINDTVREYTYSEYARLVKSTANKLSVLMGSLKKDDIVALKFKNTPTWCILFWGLLMAGFKPLLLDERDDTEKTQLLINNARAKGIITDDEYEYKHVINLKRDDIHSTNEDRDFRPRWSDEVLLLSSSTTNQQKILAYSGLNMINQINAAKNIYKENPDLVYPNTKATPLHVAALIPFHHIFAFVSIFMMHSFFGSTLVFTSFTDPLTIVKDIRDLKVTHIYHYPIFYEVVVRNFFNRLNKNERERVDALINFKLGNITHKDAGWFLGFTERKTKNLIFGPQIKCCISGGSYLGNDVAEIINGLGYPLHNGYGLSETGILSVDTGAVINDRLKRGIGHPLFGVSYKIKRNGELFVKASAMFGSEIVAGKRKKIPLDREGYYATGDAASVDGRGKYYIKGRVEDTMKASNGEFIYPDEIEGYFKRARGVSSLVCFMSNKKIVLVVYSMREDVIDDLEKLNRELPTYRQVNKFVVTNQILPLANGIKVKRQEVKHLYEHKKLNRKRQPSSANLLSNYDGGRVNDVINRLNKIYHKILDTKSVIAPDADWFSDLKQDSMSYISLLSAIEKEFKVRIAYIDYGKLTTINQFTKELIDSNCK